MRVFAAFLVLASLVGTLGCGPDVDPEAEFENVVPVSGTLTYRGKALEYCQITFLPTDGRRPAVGMTDAGGKFTMGTNAIGDGAPPGTHQVTVTYVGPPASDDTTALTPIENPSQMPQPKVKIPAKYTSAETSGLSQEVPADGISDLKIDLQ